MIRVRSLLPMLLGALLLTPTGVAAHSEFASSTPADGATLDAPPDEVRIVFSGELDPEASSFVVTDANGEEVGAGEVDLEISERNELAGVVEIDGPGTFTVAWSIAAADGHPDEGSFSFTIADPEASPAESPDTATATPGSSVPLQAIGGVLLVGGAVSAWGTWRARSARR